MPCIPTRCRTFILLRCNTAPYKRLQRVLPCRCNYTAHATKQHTWLYSGFSSDCTRSTASDNSPTQTAIVPPAPRWSAYQRPDALHRYQIPPPRRDAGQVSTAAYYNKVYKRAQHTADRASGGGSASPPAQGQPGGVSIPPTPGGWRSGTGSAIRAGGLAFSTRRGSPAAGARRAARNHWRLSPHLFSGFRPIANRGQQ